MALLTPGDTGLVADADVRAVIDAADHVYVAVDSREGPHVTPQAHLAMGGRIWMATARDTLKARTLRKHRQAGLLFRAGGHDVAVVGEAVVIDPLRPFELPAALPDALLSGLAVSRYVQRNRRDLLGFVKDALIGGDRPSTAARVLLAVRPQAVALLHDGVLARVLGHWARTQPATPWPSAAPRRTGARRPCPTRLPDLPEPVTRLLDQHGPAAVGWSSPGGPLALPATWDAALRRARVSGDLMAVAGACDSGRACLSFDETLGRHPTAKRGLVLRGAGRAERDGCWAQVTVDPRRATWWSGNRMGTAELAE